MRFKIGLGLIVIIAGVFVLFYYKQAADSNLAPSPETGQEPPAAAMVQALELAGQVVDPTGKGLAFAELIALVHEPGSAATFSWRDRRYYPARQQRERRAFRCDTHGRFSLRFEQVTELDLIMDQKGFARQRLAGIERLDQQQRQSLRIVAVEAAGIVGRVNRALWPEAESVQLSGVDQRFEDIFRLTAQGDSFALAGLPEGRYRVSVAFRKQAQPDPKGGASSKEVEVRPGQRRFLDLGFGHLHRLGGRALVEQVPVSEGMLYLLPQHATSSDQARAIELAGDGAFRFDDLAPGAYTLVLPQTDLEERDLWASLIHHSSRVEVVMGDTDLTQLFAFPRLGQVHGRLDDPRRYGLRLVGEIGLSASAADGGRFLFGQVPPGRYDLHQLVEGWEQRILGGIQVAAGGVDLDLGTVTLDADSELLVQLNGFERLGGVPATLVFLSETDPNLVVAQRSLQPVAEQELTRLPAGRLKLGLSSAPVNTSFKSAPAVLELKPGQQAELALTLTPTTLITIEGDPEGEAWQAVIVMDENGRTRKPFNRVEGLGKPDQGSGHPLLQFNDWHAEARGLKPGSYTIQVFSDKGNVAILPVNLEAQGQIYLHASFQANP